MKKSKLIVLITLICASVALLTGIIAFGIITSDDDKFKDVLIPTQSSESAIIDSIPMPEPIPVPIPEDKTIRLVAVGDNLFHAGVHLSGKQSDGTYDYSFLFETIQPYLDDADIKIINQETIFGGNHRGNDGHLGYPLFNTRTEVGDAIAKAGFNVVTQSTNHTVDQGLDGLLHCAAFWKDNYPEIMICGIRSEADSNPPIQTMEMEGVTFAFLNYTYGPNLGSFPSQYEGYMDILCYYDEKSRILDFTKLNPRVIEDIKRAEEIADVVVVCPHWGTEYITKQSSYQEKFALEMTEAGADLIIGTHPHVVQPVTYVESENGNKSLCYYSLGNYVSTQKQVECMLEAMAVVTFTVTPEGEFYINEEETGVLPLVCQYTQGSVRIDNIYLLDEYTEELALKHGMYTYAGIPFHAEDMTSLSEEVFGDWALDPYLEVLSLEETDSVADSATDTSKNNESITE